MGIRTAAGELRTIITGILDNQVHHNTAKNHSHKLNLGDRLDSNTHHILGGHLGTSIIRCLVFHGASYPAHHNTAKNHSHKLNLGDRLNSNTHHNILGGHLGASIIRRKKVSGIPLSKLFCSYDNYTHLSTFKSKPILAAALQYYSMTN